MFRLLNKSAVDIERDDLILLSAQSFEIAELAKSLANDILRAAEDKTKAPNLNEKNDREIREKLRKILTLLHSEDAEAKDSIRRELQREKQK